MSESTESCVRWIVQGVPELQPVLAEHVEDNFGELLPHVFFGDLTRWLNAEVAARPTSDAAGRLLWALDQAYANGDDDIRELVTVSFLEILDDDSPATAVLSPRLLAVRDSLAG